MHVNIYFGMKNGIVIKNTPTHYQTPGYREANYVPPGRRHATRYILNWSMSRVQNIKFFVEVENLKFPQGKRERFGDG
jgi:hypothetical protein